MGTQEGKFAKVQVQKPKQSPLPLPAPTCHQTLEEGVCPLGHSSFLFIFLDLETNQQGGQGSQEQKNQI